MVTEKLGKFFSLGFQPPPDSESADDIDATLLLGGKPKRRKVDPKQNLMWELSCWLLMTCGIFLRKGIIVVHLSWVVGNLTWQSFLASAVVALAALPTFPAFMKWFNRSRPGASLQQFATAFAYGFGLDLAAFAAHKIVPHWRT
jgi:hypothetical protein